MLLDIHEFPLEIRWHDANAPMPVRLLRVPRLEQTTLAHFNIPPWIHTGPPDAPFDFCGHVRRLLEDMAARCEELAHVDVSKILIGILQARNGRRHGLQARVTPLRFAHGQLQRRRRGTLFQVQRYYLGDHEFLYLLTFCLPRFLDMDFDQKFITLFHELFHIGPQCNGDLRRHDGRYQLHTRSKKEYDRQMAHMARSYLSGKPDPQLHGFLRLDFAQLQMRHGAVAGISVPHPKVIPISSTIDT